MNKSAVRIIALLIICVSLFGCTKSEPAMIKKTTPVSIRWFPPASLLIKTADKVVYIDPARMRSGFGKPDLPKADAILITHHHGDHVNANTVNRLAKKDTIILAPPKIAKMITRPFDRIRPGDRRSIGNIKIKATYAYNTPAGNSTRKLHRKGEGVGYLLSIREKTIYHAGDTDVIPEMSQLGKVDVAFLPIGGIFTMDIEEAAKAVSIIKPKKVIPMHYLKADPRDFKRMIKKSSKTKVEILQAGEAIVLR